jgi:hypothetical protein
MGWLDAYKNIALAANDHGLIWRAKEVHALIEMEVQRPGSAVARDIQSFDAVRNV